MRQAEESLLLNIGMPLDTVLSLESWNDIALPEGSQLEEELKLVNEQNLGLIRQRKLIEAAELRLLDAKHARLPELNATTRLSATGWEEDLSDALVEMSSLALPGSYIGLNLDLPIANWSDRGAIKQRETELAKAQIELNTLELSTTQQVRTQLRLIKSAQIKAKLAAANRAVAEKTLAADRFATPDEALKDVLSSMQALDDARIQNSLTNRYLAR